MRKAYVLDSYALLAYFLHEPGHGRVVELLSEANQTAVLYMSLMNRGEVYYRMQVARNEALARKAWADIARLPIKICWPTEQHVLAAAEMKVRHRLPFLDAFAAALAVAKHAAVVTGDPDFRRIEPTVSIEWLP